MRRGRSGILGKGKGKPAYYETPTKLVGGPPLVHRLKTCAVIKQLSVECALAIVVHYTSI